MINLTQFLQQLNINLTNLFQYPDAIVECATKEGAYCDKYIEKDPISNQVTFNVLEFENPGKAPWIKELTEEEFMGLIIENLADLILESTFDKEEELEWDTFINGAGI